MPQACAAPSAFSPGSREGAATAEWRVRRRRLRGPGSGRRARRRVLRHRNGQSVAPQPRAHHFPPPARFPRPHQSHSFLYHARPLIGHLFASAISLPNPAPIQSSGGVGHFEAIRVRVRTLARIKLGTVCFILARVGKGERPVRSTDKAKDFLQSAFGPGWARGDRLAHSRAWGWVGWLGCWGNGVGCPGMRPSKRDRPL